MKINKEDVQMFAESSIWKDIVAVALQRRDLHMQELVTGLDIDGVKLAESDLHFKRGQLHELAYMTKQPELIIAELTEEYSEQQTKEDDSKE